MVSSFKERVPLFITSSVDLQFGQAGGSNLKSSKMVASVFFLGME
jgi:hypothetical protein